MAATAPLLLHFSLKSSDDKCTLEEDFVGRGTLLSAAWPFRSPAGVSISRGRRSLLLISALNKDPKGVDSIVALAQSPFLQLCRKIVQRHTWHSPLDAASDGFGTASSHLLDNFEPKFSLNGQKTQTYK